MLGSFDEDASVRSHDDILRVLPPANHVLELGFKDPDLARAYKDRHHDAHWTAVGRQSLPGLDHNSGPFDRIVVLDFDGPDIASLEGRFDLVVAHGFEIMRDPRRLLAVARRLIEARGRLICRMANGANIACIEHALLGDWPYGQTDGSPAPRLFSPASAIKALLDEGWLPNLVASSEIIRSGAVVEALRTAALGLGASPDSFQRNALTNDMIFDCTAVPLRERNGSLAPRPRVSVVVPMTNALQLTLNIAASPGLHEMGADLVPIEAATSAADAFRRGLEVASGEWIVFCHQDVYLPRGTGEAILDELGRIPDDRAREQVVGVIGLAELTPERLADGGTHFSGTIIDRVMRLDYAPTNNAVSLDECLIILHRDCVHAIDPEMGWHFWATDLVLSARKRSAFPPCKVIGVPVFHNSLTGWAFDASFHAAITRMFAKYPDEQEIVSLCGTWQRPLLLEHAAS